MCAYMCLYITGGFSTYVQYMSMYTSEGLHECEHILVDVNIHSCVLWSVCALPASKHIAYKDKAKNLLSEILLLPWDPFTTAQRASKQERDVGRLG